MNRTLIAYAAGAVGLLVLSVVVVWLIRSEGERTRQALRDATNEAAQQVREGLAEEAERAAEKASVLSGDVIRDVKDEISGGLGGTAQRPDDDAGTASAQGEGEPTETLEDTAEQAITTFGDILGGALEQAGDLLEEESGQPKDEPDAPEDNSVSAPPPETPPTTVAGTSETTSPPPSATVRTPPDIAKAAAGLRKLDGRAVIFRTHRIQFAVPDGWDMVDGREIDTSIFNTATQQHAERFVRLGPTHCCFLNRQGTGRGRPTICIVPSGEFIKGTPDSGNLRGGTNLVAGALASQLAWIAAYGSELPSLSRSISFGSETVAGRDQDVTEIEGTSVRLVGLGVDDRWSQAPVAFGFAAPPEMKDATMRVVEAIIRDIDRNRATAAAGDATNASSDDAGLPGSRGVGAGTDASQPAAAEDEPMELPTPSDVVGDLFGLGHQITKSIDDVGQQILGLTADEEMKLGREVHDILRRNVKLVRSDALVRRLNKLAAPMLANRARKDIQYKIFVLDDPQVNAFAHVGGYLYVTKGMIDFANSEADLQFVLGHEIGHVDLKHCSKQASYMAKARDFGGDLGGQLAVLAYHAIARGYSEEQEFDADAYGMRAIEKTGRSAQDAIACLQRLKKEFDETDSNDAPNENAMFEVVQQIENHFRSHPPTSQRVASLEKLLGE